MRIYKWFVALALGLMTGSGCSGQGSDEVEVRLETTAGDIVVRLYNDTPGHRDNFIRNVKDSLYNGVLFHRVVRNFMIQTGDPDTRPGEVKDTTVKAPTIPAEIHYPRHFHKRGELAAARESDDVNPGRESDMFQFFIVTGKYVNDEALDGYEQGMLDMDVMRLYEKKEGENAARLDSLRSVRDREGVSDLLTDLLNEAKSEASERKQKIPMSVRKAYRTHGGAPWLDREYTVFGYVVDGMKVVQEIEKVKTNSNENPLRQIRIIRAVIVE